MRHALIVLFLATLVAPAHAGRKCREPDRIYVLVTVVADGKKPELASQIALHVDQRLSVRCFIPNVEHTVSMQLTFRKGKNKPTVKLRNVGGLGDCFKAIDWSTFPKVKRKIVVKLAVTAHDD